MTDTGTNLYDVGIVGLGPCGATLANLLGQAGLSVCVLEREASAYHLPRAVQFDDEIMRVFQNIGISSLIEKTTRFNPGMRFIDESGNLLLDWPRPFELSRQGWHTSYRFHQPDLEAILREGLVRFERVEIRSRCQVNTLVQHAEHVSVEYKNLESQASESIQCRYVVGCDGANSCTRNEIGAELKSFGFNERWLVVDALLGRAMPSLGDYTLQYCVPERPTTYVRGPDNRRRWEIKVLAHESSAAICEPVCVWNHLSQWVTPDDAELERVAVYTFESAVADQWRNGRVMLAGDAAHLTPPFMGQGMCAGIRDVSNLAWKLTLCCQTSNNDALLDSYQLEREPHVTDYIKTAIRLGQLINASGDAESLNTALRQPDGTTRMTSIAPRLGKTLQRADTTHGGTLSSQPSVQLSQGSDLLDNQYPYLPVILVDDVFLQKHYPALCAGTTGALSSQTLEHRINGNLTSAHVISSKGQSSIALYLRELGCKAVYIRADRYILGTANDLEEFKKLLGLPLSTAGS